MHMKVFQPKVGDHYKCRLCKGSPQRKVVTVNEKQETKDGDTFNA